VNYCREGKKQKGLIMLTNHLSKLCGHLEFDVRHRQEMNAALPANHLAPPPSSNQPTPAAAAPAGQRKRSKRSPNHILKKTCGNRADIASAVLLSSVAEWSLTDALAILGISKENGSAIRRQFL